MKTDNRWNSLDNAALIFPAAVGKAETQVFRISCELYDSIKPTALQNALDETVSVFKIYQSVLKRGLFWYYLESTDLMPTVHEENKQPCAAIYNRNQKKLLFDVSYFNNRINLEVYHVLSDGTGALHFLRTLITKYLSKIHNINEPTLTYDASVTQMSDDSFRKYYTGTAKEKPRKRGLACRLRGQKYPENRLKVITGLVSLSPLISAAHSYNTTLTVFLCACLLNSISKTVPNRAKKRPVVLSVPVNLRNHFPSATARNFFSILPIEYDYLNGSGTFEDVIKKISTDFNTGLLMENLAKIIEAYSAVEHNVFARATPLCIKDIVLKAVYNYTMHKDTAGFSNLGVITMPPELNSFIRSFDITASTNKLQVCLCSFKSRLSICFSSPFVSSEVQRRFFRSLTDLGAEVEITTNHTGNAKEEQ